MQPAAPATATLRLAAPADPVPVGETFAVTVSGLDARLSAFQFDLGYDATVIRFAGLGPGAELKGTGRNIVCPQAAQLTREGDGVRLACATMGEAGGLSGSGELAVLTFVALEGGQTELTLSGIQLPSDARPPQLLAATGQGASVTVEAACAQVADLRASFGTAEPAASGTGGPTRGAAEGLQGQSAVSHTDPLIRHPGPGLRREPDPWCHGGRRELAAHCQLCGPAHVHARCRRLGADSAGRALVLPERW